MPLETCAIINADLLTAPSPLRRPTSTIVPTPLPARPPSRPGPRPSSFGPIRQDDNADPRPSGDLQPMLPDTVYSRTPQSRLPGADGRLSPLPLSAGAPPQLRLDTSVRKSPQVGRHPFGPGRSYTRQGCLVLVMHEAQTSCPGHA